MPGTPSMEYHKYYLERLYPLQDRFLKFFNDQNQGRFYLTGGTALSRFYYQHRYSEDLDFFSTAEFKNFGSIITKFLDSARQEGFLIEVETISDHFLRIYAKEKEVSLKVDFVNEVAFRWGQLNQFPLFPVLIMKRISSLTRSVVSAVMKSKILPISGSWPGRCLSHGAKSWILPTRNLPLTLSKFQKLSRPCRVKSSNSSNGRWMSNWMKFMATFSSSLRIFCWGVLTV